MQKSHSFLFTIFLVTLIAITSGCGKKKNSSEKKQTTFSKVRDKKKNSKKATDVNAFDLDGDALKTFALDDNLDQHTTSTNSLSEKSDNKLFSWENLASDESKDQFKKLFFDFDSYSLKPSQNKDLQYDIHEAKKMIKDGKTIVIEGHACHSAGSAAYNLALSEKRARYVAKKFSEAGIDQKSIKIAPRGQEMPLRKGGTREEQAINRRVEIFAIDQNS